MLVEKSEIQIKKLLLASWLELHTGLVLDEVFHEEEALVLDVIDVEVLPVVIVNMWFEDKVLVGYGPLRHLP
jgi:hypothetical protein